MNDKTKLTVIFDLDNCLFDDRHRVPLIDRSYTGNARYEKYHAAHTLDEPCNNSLNRLFMHIMQGDKLIFLTGRPEKHRAATIAQLFRHIFSQNSHPFELIMRPDDNEQPSAIFKREALLSHKDWPFEAAIAYDDMDDVLAVYRELGIDAVKLAIEDTGSLRSDNGMPELVVLKNAEDVARFFDGLFEPGAASKADLNSIFEADEMKQFLEGAKLDAADILNNMADTFRERNKVYGDNYKRVGDVMKAMFPDGVKLETPEDFNTWHLFELIIVKLTRFANSNLKHRDSIHDAGTYCAMVESTLPE